MKKIACLLLAMMLMLVAGTALAETVPVVADYNEAAKTLTVSTSADGNFIIMVDGSDTSYALRTNSKSVTFAITLENGTHTVRILDEETWNSGSTTVKVGPEVTEVPADPTAAPVDPTAAPVDPTVAPVDPTAAPVDPTQAPTGPVKIDSASYDLGRVEYSISGLRGSAELWLDGDATGIRVSSNGSGSFKKNLDNGTHTLTVFSPEYNEQDSKSFTVAAKTPSINASYTKVGTLNYTVSNLNGESEIWLDGEATGAAVSSNGSYTLSVTLQEGSHTIMVFDPHNNVRGSYPFTVTHIAKVVPGKAATCTETGLTDGEVCEICGEVLKAQEEIPVTDHTPKAVEGKAATCTEKGLTEGSVCAVCGKELKAQEEIPALGHNYRVVDRSNGMITYKCSRCGDTFTEKDPNYVEKATKNAYGTILIDTNKVFVDYTAESNDKILVITADLSKEYTSEIGMYLNADLIAQIKAEGYTAIEYINGEADIVIELAEISDDWFDTTNAIWFYVFSTDPAAEEGTLVKVEAQISGSDKVPATEFSGVTLKQAGKEDLTVTANGIY